MPHQKSSDYKETAVQYYLVEDKSQEEIDKEIGDIKDVLFRFDTKNAEVFSQQITQIKDRAEMMKITKALIMPRNYII